MEIAKYEVPTAEEGFRVVADMRLRIGGMARGCDILLVGILAAARGVAELRGVTLVPDLAGERVGGGRERHHCGSEARRSRAKAGRRRLLVMMEGFPDANGMNANDEKAAWKRWSAGWKTAPENGQNMAITRRVAKRRPVLPEATSGSAPL